jgi:hypothetical protein
LLLSSTGNGNQQLVDGKRDLVIAWRGDMGPFKVRLFHEEDGKSIMVQQQTGLERKETKLTGVTLSQGKYRLEVIGINQRTECYLTVVQESERPEEPAEIASSGLPNDIRVLLYIAWLQERDAWRFEAMQLAAKTSLTNSAAAKILQAMKDGEGEFLY